MYPSSHRGTRQGEAPHDHQSVKGDTHLEPRIEPMCVSLTCGSTSRAQRCTKAQLGKGNAYEEVGVGGALHSSINIIEEKLSI